jgi:hypothetical protein
VLGAFLAAAPVSVGVRVVAGGVIAERWGWLGGVRSRRRAGTAACASLRVDRRATTRRSLLPISGRGAEVGRMKFRAVAAALLAAAHGDRHVHLVRDCSL